MSNRNIQPSDLELLDQYCETCLDFISPFTFREINKRGLYKYINYLPRNTNEAKVLVRARLSADGVFIGDPQMEQISQTVNRLNFLRKELSNLNMADVDTTLPIINEIHEHSLFLKDFYK